MIYLDYAATTPCEPEVVEAMLPFFRDKFANASSIDHTMGSDARRAVDQARSNVASLVGAKDEDVIFTSGSTEANNMVLGGTKRFIVTSATEHPSVLECVVKYRGADQLLILPVSGQGAPRLDDLHHSLDRAAPALVSIMHTNNETGSTNDVDSLAAASHEHGALYHSDMSQAFVSTKIDFRNSNLDGISVSAHKIYGPKGIGALVCKSALRREMSPITFGGGHERGLRSGTLNVPSIVGFGAAASLLGKRFGQVNAHLTKLRKIFLDGLSEHFSGTFSVNAGENASPHILSITMHGVNNRALLRLASQQLCFSLGSACATTKNEPSHVLRALGLSEQECNETIRISLGAGSSLEEIGTASSLIGSAANGLLEMVA